MQDKNGYLRKTKVICTLGPGTDRDDVLRRLFIKGMNVGRLNFSHGSHEEHLEIGRASCRERV